MLGFTYKTKAQKASIAKTQKNIGKIKVGKSAIADQKRRLEERRKK